MLVKWGGRVGLWVILWLELKLYDEMESDIKKLKNEATISPKDILIGVLFIYGIVMSILYFQQYSFSFVILKKGNILQNIADEPYIANPMDSMAVDENGYINSGNTVSLSDFRAIKIGMGYGDVINILGVGELLSEGEGVQMYMWLNPDASGCTIMFQNNEVMTKSQTSLK
jgi:hypothetical protein